LLGFSRRLRWLLLTPGVTTTTTSLVHRPFHLVNTIPAAKALTPVTSVLLRAVTKNRLTRHLLHPRRDHIRHLPRLTKGHIHHLPLHLRRNRTRRRHHLRLHRIRGIGMMTKGTGMMTKGTGAMTKGTGAMTKGTGAMTKGTGTMTRATGMTTRVINRHHLLRRKRTTITHSGGHGYIRKIKSVTITTDGPTRSATCGSLG
jgi:hypothetical protein